MKKLKKWVAQNGGTRATARLLGVSHATVNNWIHGKNGISRAHIKRICALSRGKINPADLI